MGWHYRHPSLFPALFLIKTREACTDPETPVLLASGSREELEIIAERYRWFKWCVKKEAAVSELFAYLQSHSIRSSISEDEAGFYLSITARVDKIAEFEAFNPELAGEINRYCQ